MSIEVAFFGWLIGIAVVCQIVEWRQKRRVNSLRDELGIVSKFHDKPIPFNKLDKNK
jgi:hypothetical protein